MNHLEELGIQLRLERAQRQLLEKRLAECQEQLADARRKMHGLKTEAALMAVSHYLDPNFVHAYEITTGRKHL